MFSGGAGSWAAAERVIERHGKENTCLLFADTSMEDEDLYRFLNDAEKILGLRVTYLREGRDPWQVFRDVRFLGNTRIDPCSRVLKREFIRAWLEKNFDSDNVTIYLGMDWTEIHRYEKALKYWHPWKVQAPMCDKPYIDKEWVIVNMAERGLQPPRLYSMGFAHNNCGGFCIKAGLAHFKLLLEKLPERYVYHERKEIQLQIYLNKIVSILRDRRGGQTRPLPLWEFRVRVEGGEPVDPHDIGGCGCFSPVEATP
jgi:hypothetical protein